MAIQIAIVLFCFLVSIHFETCSSENIDTSKRIGNNTKEKTLITFSALELMNLLQSPLVKQDRIPKFMINQTFDFEVDSTWA